MGGYGCPVVMQARAVTLDDLAAVKQKVLFMQEFIEEGAVEKASGQACCWLSGLWRSHSWPTLETGTQTPLPLPVCEQPLEFYPDPLGVLEFPSPLGCATCVSVRVHMCVSAAGSHSPAGRDQTSCLSPVIAAVQEVHTDPLGGP